MKRLNTWLLAAGLSAALPLCAAPLVQVVGLFPGAAVISVDGVRKLVRQGQTGPSGVVVVSVDRSGALLKVDGREQRYELSREYNQAGYSAPKKQQFSIARGAAGHYWASGSMNGQPTQFLVDTGATSIAMNEAQARRLGIDFRVNGTPMVASTASGTVRGWSVHLDSVKVGPIEVMGVEAAVLEGESPSEVLLGMSFLNRVRWREDQGVLVLESKL